MDYTVCDLENYDKNLRKIKEGTKVINAALITEREKERYLEIFGRFPEEFPDGSEGQLEWSYPRTKESKEYVKKITEANETHTAKRPSRSKKAPEPAKNRKPWTPPKH